MMRLANGALHALHLIVIGFCTVAWAFPVTRPLHLVVCALTLLSWFVIGPLLRRPGYCFLTGLQHWMWQKQGRDERPNYMAYLYQRCTGRTPGVRSRRTIDITTQAVLYSCTALSIYLA